jgi:preprotein translocase subunit SecF
MIKWPLIRNLPREFHIDFVRLAPVAAVISALFVAASIGSFIYQGLNLGIDFRGGALVEVKSKNGPAPLGALRAALPAAGGHDGQVQAFGSPELAGLRFRTEANTIPAAEQVRARLQAKFPGIEFKQPVVVGAKVSSELASSGILALGVALLLMLFYIWFRFQLQFGLGAVVAVFHDVILTLGLLSATQIEFSMTSIAALLTVIGYSMNEKVITFDRLRENLRKYKTTPLRDVINRSENERLSRTLITGSTAILALAGAFFLGGPVLFPLVSTMVFGIFIGTYSSVYVALPIILLWGVKRNDDPAVPLKPAGART